MTNLTKIALGGGCHWCTEAVFQALKGVDCVAQGFVASEKDSSTFSEAVIVYFNKQVIPLKVLINIHLLTHKSSVNHSMRSKYRSAVYTFSEAQFTEANMLLTEFKSSTFKNLVTQVLPFKAFKASRQDLQNYYIKNPDKPFCKKYINPKLHLLLQEFSVHTNQEKLMNLKT
ncbi:peptide-methionine (S)-S-oxide reductase [Bizionia sediminis]|uniref:peptide-methionine (S)-S-oxide reductase n=1 Tax=Bizionia sediminis TaxID=1737064 RepID=A0ABW5KT64_9FLAO